METRKQSFHSTSLVHAPVDNGSRCSSLPHLLVCMRLRVSTRTKGGNSQSSLLRSLRKRLRWGVGSRSAVYGCHIIFLLQLLCQLGVRFSRGVDTPLGLAVALMRCSSLAVLRLFLQPRSRAIKIRSSLRPKQRLSKWRLCHRGTPAVKKQVQHVIHKNADIKQVFRRKEIAGSFLMHIDVRQTLLTAENPKQLMQAPRRS